MILSSIVVFVMSLCNDFSRTSQCKINMITDIILAQQLLEVVALQYGFNPWIDA